MNRTVRLWAKTPRDLKTLTSAAQSVFPDASIDEKGAYVWRNTGSHEDTRVGMTRADESHANNPTYRLLAEFNVTGAGLLTLREDLQQVADLLPQARLGTFSSDSAVVFGAKKIQSPAKSAPQYSSPEAAIA